MKLIENNIQKIIALCKKHKVGKLFVFGSILTNRFNEKSDVDMVVDFDKVNLEDYADNYFDFKYSLEELFGREVDLLEDKAIRNPILRRNIDNSKQLVYDEYIEKYLIDVLNATIEVESYFADAPKLFQNFQKDMLRQRAVERNVEIMGEAINRILRVDPSFELPNAKAIINTRNRVIHGYDSVTTEFLWSLIIRHIPALKKDVEHILANKYNFK